MSKCVGKYRRLPNDGNYRQIEIKIENKNFNNVYPPNEEVNKLLICYTIKKRYI